MRRFALPLALLLAACGDETVGTASGSTTTDAGTTTTGGPPTTSGTSSSSTSTSTSSASDSATGTTTGDPDTGSTTPGLDATSNEESGTTVDPSTSDATTGTSTSGTSTSGTSSSGTASSDSSSSDTSTSDDSTGPEVLVPPVPGGSCNFGQGELTTFVEPLPQPDELHIVAMYQATGNAATVTITRVGVPLTLFLSSYEPVAFTLDVAPGVQLEHVILDGYNMHTLQGQGAAMVTDISGNFGDPFWVACGYFWPMNDGGCDTPDNVAAAEGLTGLQLASFAGCYEGIAFTLE